MPTVEFLPSGLSAEVPPGTELLEAIRQAGIELDASCGGQGTCGACLVRVVAGRVDASASPPAGDFDPDYVQACTTRVLDVHITVEVPEQAGREEGVVVGYLGQVEAHLVLEEVREYLAIERHCQFPLLSIMQCS